MILKYCSFLFAILLSNTIVAQNNITIDVQKIEGEHGFLQIGIFDTAKSFPKVGGEYKVLKFKVADGQTHFIIKDLPDGEYAFAVHHDENSDGKMNTNMLGIPKEGYGFSRNFKPKLSAPKFSDCSVKIQNDQKMIIRMIY